MLATIPERRRIDFSHLLPDLAHVELGESVRDVPAHKQKSPLLWFMLCLSLLLHLSLLLVNIEVNKAHVKPELTQTLHIDLVPIPIKKPVVAAESITQPVDDIQAAPRVVSDIIAAPIIAPIVAQPIDTTESSRVTRRVIKSLSWQELHDIADSRHTPREQQSSAAIGDNVFHPGLRARLTTEANKPALARVEDSVLKNHLDPAGATVVKLADGNCLRASAAIKTGAPRDWYMTACGGRSESETMMERVNRDTKGRLNFEE